VLGREEPHPGRSWQVPRAARRRALVIERAGAYAYGMCRNIRPLYNFEPPASPEEVHGAAVQYVRKISGFTKPSKANEEAFQRALDAVTEASSRLLDELVSNAPPKNREAEAATARERTAKRFAAA